MSNLKLTYTSHKNKPVIHTVVRIKSLGDHFVSSLGIMYMLGPTGNVYNVGEGSYQQLVEPRFKTPVSVGTQGTVEERKPDAEGIEELLRTLAGGTIFSVLFTKKDRSLRRMVCRFNVKSGLKDCEHCSGKGTTTVVQDSSCWKCRGTGKEHKGMAYKPNEKGLICVYDTQKQAYRMINVAGIREIKVAGKEFKFNELGKQI